MPIPVNPPPPKKEWFDYLLPILTLGMSTAAGAATGGASTAAQAGAGAAAQAIPQVPDLAGQMMGSMRYGDTSRAPTYPGSPNRGTPFLARPAQRQFGDMGRSAMQQMYASAQGPASRRPSNLSPLPARDRWSQHNRFGGATHSYADLPRSYGPQSIVMPGSEMPRYMPDWIQRDFGISPDMPLWQQQALYEQYRSPWSTGQSTPSLLYGQSFLPRPNP